MITVKNRNGRMGIPRTCCVKWCVWRDQFIPGDQRNTSHTKFTSKRSIQDLRSYWLTSNFSIKGKRPYEPSKVKFSVILNQPLCSSWVKVRFSSLPEQCIELNSKESATETQTPSNSFPSHLCWKTWPGKTIFPSDFTVFRGCFVIVNLITLSWDAFKWDKLLA